MRIHPFGQFKPLLTCGRVQDALEAAMKEDPAFHSKGKLPKPTFALWAERVT